MEHEYRLSLPYTVEAVNGTSGEILGDAYWANYQAEAELEFSSDAPENYAEIGIRCPAGFFLRLYADGRWALLYGEELLKDGTVPEFRHEAIHRIGIGAIGAVIFGFADGQSLCEIKLERPIIRSGGIMLQGGNKGNRFGQITARTVPAPMPSGCYRLGRETAQISGNATEIRFYGSGIWLLGTAKQARAAFWVDGKLYSESVFIAESHLREAFFTLEPLRKGWHTLRMELLDGALELDDFEIFIPTDDVWKAYDVTHFPSDSSEPLAGKGKSHTLNLKKAVFGTVAGLALGVAAASLIKKKK